MNIRSFASVVALDTSGGARLLHRLRVSADLSEAVQFAVLLLLLVTVVLLAWEARAHQKQRGLIFTTGVLGTIFLVLAVLRPTQLKTEGREVPGRAVVLMDASHRLELPIAPEEINRRQRSEQILGDLKKRWASSRIEVQYFGGQAGALENGRPRGGAESDLLAALRGLRSIKSESPQSVVVLSDGRLATPGPKSGDDWTKELRRAAGGLPVHTVAITPEIPQDRSIRSVGLTGSAVAHQPFTMAIEIGCEPNLQCDQVEVIVSELLEGQAPVELVRGETEGKGGLAQLELEVTLDRAGARVVEIRLLGNDGDDIAENDRRILPIQVRRDRLRMLHVAGRPSYDVRALRMFLKSDKSIDLVSFFILRTTSDQVGAQPDELALIPFPVNELFSEHLKSFDAVILQDIDARQYELDRHFSSLTNYVLSGGGLILVGGPTGFSSGGYAGSKIAKILPIELPTEGRLIAPQPFVPVYTAAGRAAPLLENLRATMKGQLPMMSGANIFGRPQEGALVLWQHPSVGPSGQAEGEGMPVLAISEVGDGRTIAISVDSTHQLRFGEVGAESAGRAYSDLWGGLLGWLMRDPRYGGSKLRLEGECISGRDQLIRVERTLSTDEALEVSLVKLGTQASDLRVLPVAQAERDGVQRYVARDLSPGGYAARVKVGDAPPTRTAFACEAGGEAWSDSRPDPQRLGDIARATGGVSVEAGGLDKLPVPPSNFIAAKSKSRPLLPTWVWALAASFFMAVHWIVRRALGIV